MENAEEVMQILERFTRLKQKEIPKELDDYLQFVAKTGDTVFKWANLKYLFREKLLNVITHFYDTTPRMDEIPQYPNVDPFNYESMKSSLLERLELFNAAPFTIQRLCELLIDPKKQYNRIDKFMRALEKNILVSTVEPGRKRTESENGDSLDSVVNGDISLDVNVDIDMENESLFNMEATQNGNGTAAAVSPVGTTETTNDTERVSDNTKQEDESNAVVNVTSTHEPPTGDDEDLQPSPKKVKLDTDVETVAVATTVEVPTKPAEKVEEVTVEKVEATEKVAAKEIDEEKNLEDKEAEKPEIKVKTNGVSEKSEQTVAKPDTTEETKQEMETEKKVETAEKESATEKICEIKKNEIVESSSNIDPAATTTVTSKTTTKDNDISKKKTEVDSSVSKEEAKLDEISSAVEQNEQQEAAEKIIEKQEIEKCEKEMIPAKVENKCSIKDDTPTQSEKEKPVEPKSDAKPKVKDAPKEEKEPTKQSNNEAEVAAKDAVTPKDTSNVADTTAGASSAVESDADKLITSSTTVTTTEEAKTDDVETCVTTTEDVKKVDAAPKIVETATTITSTLISEIPKSKEIETPSEAAIVAAPIDKKLPAVKTDDVVETPTAETIVAATDAAVAAPVAAVVVAITPPTLALNDQPMDEDAITNVVDEVVMAESITTTTGDAIEMATDAMEATVSSDAAKIDEPADGMDVDDTSPQEEAMDQ